SLCRIFVCKPGKLFGGHHCVHREPAGKAQTVGGQASGKVKTLEKGSWVEPEVGVPSGDIRRAEQPLSHSGRRLRRRGESDFADRILGAEPPHRSNHHFDWALAQRRSGSFAQELVGQEHCAHHLFDRVLILLVHPGELVDRGPVLVAIRQAVYKEFEEFSGYEAGGRLALADQGDYIEAIQVRRRTTEDRLRPEIVLGLVEKESRRREPLERPSGEGPRHLLHVLLRVVGFTCYDIDDPHRMEFHQLASIVLVWVILVIVIVIQVPNHCRILRNAQQKRVKLGDRIFSENEILLNGQRSHYGNLRREVAVPEQGHLLFERAG